MMDRERMREWQRDRDDADRAWRDEQRRFDRRWHIIEFVAICVFCVLVLAGALLGPLIARGSVP